MKYTHCFFDLDGTVIDSSPGITNSVAYALSHMGITPPPKEALYCFIGPSLMYGFSTFFHMNEEDSRHAVALYRENYSVRGMYECTPYDGIVPLLQKLNEAGVVCVLATCKPHIYAKEILRHHGLDRYFAFVSGPELDGTRDTKEEVIAYAAEHLGVKDLSQAAMIGDRGSDIVGAKHHGMHGIGVLWGFGEKSELEDAGADFVCTSVDELATVLLGK
jgi:phosphoglycolate phosphatase